MKSRILNHRERITTIVLILAGLCCALPMMSMAQAQPAATTATAGPKGFDTPQQAADAIIKAAADLQRAGVVGDPWPRRRRSRRLRRPGGGQEQRPGLRERGRGPRTRSRLPSRIPNRATIIVGEEEWPAPIPLVKKNGKWYFNTKEGKQEILFRRIGANELDAITVCRGYVSGAKGIRLRNSRRFRREPVRAEDHQHARQAGWSVLEECRRHARRPHRRSRGQRAGGRLQHATRRVPRLLLQDPQGTGTSRPQWRNQLRHRGCHDWRLRSGGRARRISRDRASRPSSSTTTESSTRKTWGRIPSNIVKNMELYNPDKTWQRTDDQWPENVATVAP